MSRSGALYYLRQGSTRENVYVADVGDTGASRQSFRGIGSATNVNRGPAWSLNGRYLAPGFIDLHVHGGDGADFMDGTAEAFRTVCRCHARHECKDDNNRE